MRAGQLRHRLTILEARSKQTTTGGAEREFVPISADSVRWASIEPLTSRELVQAAQAALEVTHRIRMRYVRGLTSLHQLRQDDAGGAIGGATRERRFHIASIVNVDERDAEHELLCREVA